MRICYTFVVVLMAVKIIFYLRIFDGFGFLVSMVKEVIVYLRYFLAFFSILIIAFTMVFNILGIQLEGYDGVGNIGYLIMTVRTAFGDF